MSDLSETPTMAPPSSAGRPVTLEGSISPELLKAIIKSFRPDLTIRHIPEESGGTFITFEAGLVKGVLPPRSGSTRVAVRVMEYFPGQPAIMLGDVEVDLPNAGGVIRHKFTWPNYSEGSRWRLLFIDPEGRVSERNERNNVAALWFTYVG